MNVRADPARQRSSEMSSEAIDIVVTDPQGLRARVEYPPFSTAAPLLDYSTVQLGTGSESRKAVRLNIGCASHPEAAAFIKAAGAANSMIAVSISMRAHESGNGYVVLRASQDSDSAACAGPALETALDPVEHRTAIEALGKSGVAILVVDARPGHAASGLVIQIDQDKLDTAKAAALSHPRRIRFG